MFKKKSAFTLVEIVIVLALLGFFAVMLGMFSADKRIYQERATYMAQTIADMIRDSRYNTIIGRGRYDESGDLTEVSERTFFLSSEKFGSYFDEQAKNVEKQYTKEGGFFDNDPYYTIEKIESISFGKKTFQEISDMKIIFSENRGEVDSKNGGEVDEKTNVSKFRITVEYKGFKRYIEVNPLSGVVSIYNTIDANSFDK